MHFLAFIFELAFLFVTFDILWSLILFLFKAFLGIDRSRNSLSYYILKIISLYLLTSLTVLITYRHLEIHTGPLNHITYPTLALVILTLYVASDMHRRLLKARLTLDEESLRRYRFNGLFLFSVIVYFFLSLYFALTREPLFNAWILENNIVHWFITTTDKVYHIILLRIILGFLALVLLVRIILRGILSIRLLIYGFFGLPEEENPWMQRFKKDFMQVEEGQEEFTDYEEVKED